MKKEVALIVLVFLIWRLLLFVPLFLGKELIPYKEGQDFTNILKYVPDNLFVSHYLIFPWANFDGVHYLLIAKNGYTDDGRFLPFYPILIKFLTSIIAGFNSNFDSYFIAGFFISNICFIAALIILYKLITDEYTINIARQSVFFLLIFPTSYFFVSLYSESLFLLLTVLFFYYLKRNNLLIVTTSGLLLTVTRLVGIAVVPILFYRLWILDGFFKKSSFKIFPFLLIPLGIIGYGFYCLVKWNDFFYFIHGHGLQGNGRSVNSIVFPLQTVVRYFKILLFSPLTNFEWWIALLEFLVFVFITVIFYLAWKKKIKPEYLIFWLTTFLIPTLSGTFSGLPRYVLVLFPLFLTLALMKNRWFKVFYSTISITLLFILLMFFSKGYFIA